jgi:phospholipid transport system substrate-binding protein
MRSRAHGWRFSRRAVLVAAAGLVATAGVAGLADAQDASAEAFVQTVGHQVLTVLEDQSLGDQQKVAKLKQILNQATNLELVARIILGRYWPKATPQQRQEYLRLFDALVMQAMAERIHSYTGQTFDITGSRKVDDQDTVVQTMISQPSGGQQYHVDWRVRKTGDKFQLIDIVAEGVSLVVTQRSDVNDIVSQQGIDGLLAEMRRRLAQQGTTGQAKPKQAG